MEDRSASDRAAIESLIAMHGLGEVASEIVALLRPCVRIATEEPAEPKALGTTRLGGVPDLPSDTPWPEADGRLLSLLLQLNLRDVAGADTGLPKSGWMWFFLGASDTTTDITSAVMYSEASELHLATVPRAAVWHSEYDDYSATPHFVKLFKTIDLPSVENKPEWSRIESRVEGDQLRDFMSAVDKLWDIKSNQNSSFHRIGGFAGQFTEDSRPDVFPGLPAEQVRLLFQAGWDRKVGFNFWDAGELFFMIPERDLAARRFKNAKAFLHSG